MKIGKKYVGYEHRRRVSLSELWSIAECKAAKKASSGQDSRALRSPSTPRFLAAVQLQRMGSAGSLGAPD